MTTTKKVELGEKELKYLIELVAEAQFYGRSEKTLNNKEQRTLCSKLIKIDESD